MKQKILIVAALLMIATASFAFVMRDSSVADKECAPSENCGAGMPGCCQGGN